MSILKEYLAVENKVISRDHIKYLVQNLMKAGYSELAFNLNAVLELPPGKGQSNRYFRINNIRPFVLPSLNAPGKREGTRFYQSMHGGRVGETIYLNIAGYDWQIITSKRSGGKLISTAQALKVNDDGSTTFAMFSDPNINLITQKARATEKTVKDQHYKALNVYENLRVNEELPVNKSRATKEKDNPIKVGLKFFLDGYGKENEPLYIYEIKKSKWGITYDYVNGKTLALSSTDRIRPYSEKFGIGVYYMEPPQYIDENKLTDLVLEAKQKSINDKKRQDSEQLLSGVKRSAQIEEGKKLVKVPTWAKAVIVAEFYINDSDSMTDYFHTSADGNMTVYLGYSKTNRNNMGELKSAAKKFDETKDFSENNKKFENRQNFSGLPNFYFGEDNWHGWKVSKLPYFDPQAEKSKNEIYVAAAEGRTRFEVNATKKSLPDQAPKKTGENDQPTATLNPTKAGIEVSFPGKPNPKILECLKAAKFRWSRKQKIWYAKDIPATHEALKKCGIELTISESKKEAPKPDPKAKPINENPKKDNAKVMATTKAKECHAVLLPIDKLATDTDRFQNRKGAFSELTARTVAEKFNPNKFDPVVIWVDPKTQKQIVISGHSRLEGMKRRKATEIPARYFEGTEKEAIKFAKVDANRSADKESLVEDLKAFQLLRDGDTKADIEPVTKAELKEAFPGNANKLEAYTYLNPTGLFITVLGQSNLSEYPHIESRAMWAGELARDNPDVWGKLMERNLFYFFYRGDGQGIKLSKAEFFDLAQKRIDTLEDGQQVLFPECESDGCEKLQNDFARKLTGDVKKQLHENKELQRFILSRFKTSNKGLKVWTDEEKDYLKKVVLKDLEKQADRLTQGLDDLENNQGDLFGLNGAKNVIKNFKKKSGLNGPILDGLEKVNKAIESGKKVAESVKATSKNVLSIKDIFNMKFDKLNLPPKWAALMQNVPTNFTAMVYGQGKNGKSSFSLQMAKMLSTKGLTLYNFAEQGITGTTQDLIKNMGIAETDNLLISGGRTLEQLRANIKQYRPQFVFVDLMNYYGISPDEMFTFIKSEFPKTAFILVMEATKDGNFKGNNGWLHIVDARIECKDFVATNSGRLGFGEFVIWPERVAQLEAEKNADKPALASASLNAPKGGKTYKRNKGRYSSKKAAWRDVARVTGLNQSSVQFGETANHYTFELNQR
jgi:hypothetical protein